MVNSEKTQVEENTKDGKVKELSEDTDFEEDDYSIFPNHLPNTSPPAEVLQDIVTEPNQPKPHVKKGQIVRVDKEKYLNSINYLSVGHPPYYKGLEYIYEDRGEVLDIRIFETGEYALIGWVGIPTAPAWLPTEILIKVSMIIRIHIKVPAKFLANTA
nr:NAD(P)H-quinone oxidoreductase subunit O, chloroplastic [Ipomoea batatas]